ncbi:MAG: hypothetical protein JW994_02970 [Candidatus Omnitrophica bacterium]|nr:hypothetical protein [Candidatus Omnitrophota bacterium]
MRKTPEKIKNKAINLRTKGLSLSEIALLLNTPKNTIQGLVKGIKLTRLQKERLRKKSVECGKKGLKKATEVNRIKIEQWKKGVKQRTEKFQTIIHKKSDMAKLLCGTLYLCEGAKYPATRQLVFGNSDSRMIKLFLSLLRKNFSIDEKKFRCRIMHRYDQDGEVLNRHWSKLTGIPLGQFYKDYKDKRTKGRITTNKNYKGICAVQYLSTDLQYELQLIGESIYFLNN